MNLKLNSAFQPTGDQPQAIDKLVKGLKTGLKHQVLLGVTGSGKTYTVANVIERIHKPTLVISHNKTLAAQLYQEFRDFFPQNAVSYFVSYYDFYQPEAYVPQTDTYIEKETEINEEIDKLRLAATTNLLTRKDTIVVASVSCIYNLGSPKIYGKFVLELKGGVKLTYESIIARLVDLQYQNSKYQFKRGTFRIRGENIDIFPSYEDYAIRLIYLDDYIQEIYQINATSGREINRLNNVVIYPAKHFITDQNNNKEIFKKIRQDLDIRVKQLKDQGKLFEAQRLIKRVNFDLEMIEEVGYVNGIENYSRYFDGRRNSEPPYTLLDYFNQPFGNDWLLIIDESHMTIPQLRGMYNGDRSRKQTLIDFGFRLPSALDNRPLTFTEFSQRVNQIIYLSATPSDYERSISQEEAKSPVHRKNTRGSIQGSDLKGVKGLTLTGIVEQLIRPTGIVDPKIIVRPSTLQIIDLVSEILIRKKRKERVLVITLTKRMSEDLASFLNEKKYLTDKSFANMKIDTYPIVHYLHSDVETLERSDILDDLRSGKYDVLVGINLLREGLDLPEVSLVAILDADKEGFLRSEISLIQTMGRAARSINGTVIMYADKITDSMKKAIFEVERRRNFQLEYNIRHNIIPQDIIKPIREKLIIREIDKNKDPLEFLDTKKRVKYRDLLQFNTNELTPADLTRFIKKLEKEMKLAASCLDFELAAEIRDKIRELKT